MKKRILASLLTMILSGCSWLGMPEDLQNMPDAYKEPQYCEQDQDCRYEVRSGCCGAVVNKYNKNANLWDGNSICDMVCPPGGIHDYYCENRQCSQKINCEKACALLRSKDTQYYGYTYINEQCACR